MSSCTTSDDALLKWTRTKRKLIVRKYGTPSGTASTHVAELSDMSHDDSQVHASLDMPTMEECTDECDDTKASVPFSSVALSSSLAHVTLCTHDQYRR
jgi:hypothetical protein